MICIEREILSRCWLAPLWSIMLWRWYWKPLYHHGNSYLHPEIFQLIRLVF